HHLGAAMQRVERLRPARGHAPFDVRHRLRDRRRCDARRTRNAQAGDLDKISTFHFSLLAIVSCGLRDEACLKHGTPGSGFPSPSIKKPGLAKETGLRLKANSSPSPRPSRGEGWGEGLPRKW